MTRRERIKIGMGAPTGGTEAPTARRKQIREGLAKGPAGARTLPAGIPPIRYPTNKARTPETGSPLRAPVPVGKQLQGRVQSGAINSGQAQTVARQRAMLQKAFGSDWRTKVFGQGGAKGISGPFAQSQIRAKRSAALGRAKRKLY